jgi:hypothetical protein
MSPNALYRLSGVALVIGGLLFTIGNLMHPLDHSAESHQVARWTAAHATFMTGSFGMLLGLPALYVRQSARSGVLGLVAFTMFFIGTASILGGSWFEAFGVPVLDEAAIHEVEHGPGVPYNAVTGIMYLVGQVLFAVTMFRARKEGRPATLAFLAASIVLVPMMGFTGDIAGMLIIGATAVIGVALAWHGALMAAASKDRTSTHDSIAGPVRSIA